MMAFIFNDTAEARALAASEGVRTWTRYPLTIVWDPNPWASEWRGWKDEACRYLKLGYLMIAWHGCR